jgi:hypothetical protein
VLEKNHLPNEWKNVIPNYIKWLEMNNECDNNHLISFYKGITALDKKRKTSIIETFPKLEPLYYLGMTYFNKL